MSASGEGGRGTVALDVPLAAGAVATYQISELVQVMSGQEPQRLRLVAKGIDRNGVPFEVAPLEIGLVNEARMGGGEWARNDLDASASVCTLAYWHHPLFSSGGNGNISQMREIWRLLDSHHAEVVLVGHDHDYERFAPQDADGTATAGGVREFVVGTGGAPLRPIGVVKPNSQIRENQTWGVLRLMLRAGTYSWEFVPIDGQSFRDFGTTACVP